MKQSVEHLGPQHEAVALEVAEGVVMLVCPEFELRRFIFMQPFLAEHALMFQPEEFPYSTYPSFDVGGRCYDQAMDLAVRHNLIYVEGVILGNVGDRPFPMPHAWCTTTSGQLIDPTAHKVQGNKGLQYIGVPFRTDYAMLWHAKYGWHGMLDGHPTLGDSVGVYVDPKEMWFHPAEVFNVKG